jgi:hypothetical protein
MSSKYPLLNDPKWLYGRYITEGLSTIQICRLAGAKTPNSVRQALLKHSIPVRTIGEGLKSNKESDGLIVKAEDIEGCLLGDGYLRKWRKDSSNACPYFAKRNKFYDHVKFVAQILFGHKWEERVRESEETILGKKAVIFSLRSLSNEHLKPFYERWYPAWNDYRKVIPSDLRLTPRMVLHWFLDDGNSYQRRKDSKKKQVVITLCSESFSMDDQQMIVDKMRDDFGIKGGLKKVPFGTGYRIQFSQSQAPLFYDIVGPCPVPSMGYKWK